MRIATLQDAATVLSPFFEGAEAERVVAMHLSAGQELLGVTLEEVGGRDEVALPVRAIVASTLRLGAAGLLVAHNHPSGDPEPSAADRDATRRLADALGALGVRLVDHLVFAGGDLRSMAAMGLL
jgi:DNA repair protein RadC